MKKTRRKHLRRTIAKTGVSFFAVAFIAGTSIAIFLGFHSTANAILNKADGYFEENRLETLEIACANGITQEDIEAIAKWDGVSAVEGGYSTVVTMDGEEEKITLQALSLCEDMNEPVLLEGTLPAADNEVAVEEKFAKEKGIKVGDTFSVAHDGSLLEDTFQVTAIINQPAYCCANVLDSRGKSTEGLGSASYYISLPKEAFDSSYYQDCFSKVHVRNDSLDEYYFYSDDYKEKEADFKEMAEELGEERAQLRYTSLKEEADSAIADAKEEIAEAEQEIADGDEEIADATEELASKQEKLDAGLAEIQKNLKALGITTDLEEAPEQLEPFGDAAKPLTDGIAAYEEGMVQLADAQSELADAKSKIEDSRQELDDAKTELADAEDEAEEIELKDWIVSDRNEVGDVRGVKTIVDSIYGLSYSMSVIFLLVAIIVCYAAITRMIEEQRVLIGAQKALGFHAKEILNHYMVYNALCALLGVMIGWTASVGIVELLVLHIYSSKFVLGSIPLAFAWKEALLAAGMCLVVFLTAAYIACAKLIRQPATELLRGEVPVKGKKYFFDNWKWYKKRNLYSRTMIKNVLNDKGRMMTTIMGVVGCLSLLLMCISLKLAIADSSVWQFDKYFFYDHRLVFDSSIGKAQDFEEVLDEQGISYTLIQDKLENFRVDGGNWENGRIVAADDEALKDFMVLEDIESKEHVSVPEDGLLVSRKAAEDFGLSKGSVVEFMDGEGDVRELQIAGVIEHYLAYHLFVTSESYFSESMGEDPDACVFLLKGDAEGLYEKVKGLDGFMSLKDNSEFDEDSSYIDPVIGICLLLAAVMSLLVLLNQVVMYINRKARELAVMRINGYTMKETRAYVYKDNIILTILGLAVGCGIGLGLSYAVIRAVETGAIHYVRQPNAFACLCSCGIVAVFAFIVNLIALRKIKHLNLTNVSGN